MNRNWINIIATILIVGGVYLLVVKKQAPKQLPVSTTRPMNDDEARGLFYSRFENTLGRPLNDIEKQMITIRRDGSTFYANLSEPLLSRVKQAERERKAAEVASRPTSNPAAGVPSLDSAGDAMPATMPSMR